MTGGRFNGLNQLTDRINGGRVRIAGHLTNKPGTVVVGTNAAVMDREHTSFVAYAEVANGSNVISIAATDFQGHSATNRYQINVASNSVAKTLTYDLNGNLTTVATAGSTQTYAWDAADRLVSITRSGDGTNLASSRFEYDGTGRRVRIVEMTNNTTLSDKRFVWAGSQLAEERTSSGAVTRRFFGQGEQIGGTNYYFTRDHLGSVREMTDATATVRARYEYDPYGRRTRVEGSIDADFGFTGHYVHSPSGLHLALFRAYDADTGRWLSRDPIAEKGGLNLYGYLGNNPIMYFDPFGLTWGDGIRNGLIGVGVGVVLGAVVVAALPASVAAGIAMGAAAVGGYMIGNNAYEFVSGEEAYTGRPLTQDEWETRGGHAMVDAATFGVAKCKWFNRGAKNDGDWLKLPPGRRWKTDSDLLTTSPGKFDDVRGVPPGQRGLTPFDIDPRQYWGGKEPTWRSGASPGLRFVWPFGAAGSGVSEQVQP